MVAEETMHSTAGGSASTPSGRKLRGFSRTTSQLAMGDLRAFLDSWLARNPERRRVLDAGCGSQMYFYLPPDAHVVGVDIDAERLRENRSIAEKIVGDVQTYPFPAASFDLVICYEVLEHVRRPELAVENLRRAVAPGGLLVLGGPNLLSLKGLVTRLTPYWLHRSYYRRSGADVEPFKTYLRYATTPARIAEWARESSLVIEYATVVESPLQARTREKMRLTGRLWTMIQRFASAVTLGFIDLAATDFAIALSKPE